MSSIFRCGHVPVCYPGDELTCTYMQRPCRRLFVTTWLLVVKTGNLDAQQRSGTDGVPCCNVARVGLELAV